MSDWYNVICMQVLKDEISPRYIVLLNDMILYCKDWTGSTLKCLRVLPIDKCVINAIGFKRGVFSLQCQSFSVILSSKDDQELTHDWVEAIQNAIDQVRFLIKVTFQKFRYYW